MTSEFGPTTLSSPTVTGPATHAPAPSSTRSPMMGTPPSSPMRKTPKVVFCRICTSSPMERAPSTMPPWCQMRTRRPTFVL
ncbi:MAG: hypothetical protein A2138_02935 [Deltaproteobacteria bacterium RBG_16_71_12]|nr:MAG: hypothetical protein A2138_02935 [Deltaproteobacteria bacterium RBG_16_71_12]